MRSSRSTRTKRSLCVIGAVGRAVVGEGDLEAVAQERGDRVARAGDEEPVRAGPVVPGVSPGPRGVVRRIDAEGDQADRVGARRERLLERRHARRERGADVGAAREDEVRDPDAAARGRRRASGAPGALGQRERRDRRRGPGAARRAGSRRAPPATSRRRAASGAPRRARRVSGAAAAPRPCAIAVA